MEILSARDSWTNNAHSSNYVFNLTSAYTLHTQNIIHHTSYLIPHSLLWSKSTIPTVLTHEPSEPSIPFVNPRRRDPYALCTTEACSGECIVLNSLIQPLLATNRSGLAKSPSMLTFKHALDMVGSF